MSVPKSFEVLLCAELMCMLSTLSVEMTHTYNNNFVKLIVLEFEHGGADGHTDPHGCPQTRISKKQEAVLHVRMTAGD